MIGSSFAGVAVDARKIVAVLDRIEENIGRSEAARDRLQAVGAERGVASYVGELIGLDHARKLLLGLLAEAEGGAS